MKRKSSRMARLLAFLIICALSVSSLSACVRSAPRVESYGAAEDGRGTAGTGEGQGTAGTGRDNAAEGMDGVSGIRPKQPVSAEEAARVQADFDAFTNEIFREELSEDPIGLHCYLRHPENYGIDVSNPSLGDFSLETLREDTGELKETRETLHSFDTSLLTSDQLFTYKMFDDYLETELASDGLELYFQPLSPVIGLQAQLPILFAEYTFHSRQDVEHYLILLSQIDGYYKQLADFENVRADAGLAPSDKTLDRIMLSCKDYMIRPENSFLTDTFDSKLEDIPDLTDAEKQEFKARHIAVLKEHFIPAYQNLHASLEALKGRGTNENGLCGLEGGKEYYEYLVASQTGTDSSVLQLRKRIEEQAGQDLGEMTLLLHDYPEVSGQLDSFAFSLSEPVEILENLRAECEEDFPKLPKTPFTVKHVPKALESSLSPAFFLVPPLDDASQNVIYINDKAKAEGESLYTILAHEGYPGHLYQNLYNAQKNTCPLRRLIGCGGYSEGWGTYAEIYSYSFHNGLSEPLAKLLAVSQSNSLALYAMLDIRIHYEGWDLERTTRFLSEYYGITDREVCEEIFQSIVDNPANYLMYYTGCLEISSMRETAESTLKNRYQPAAFHKFILDMGEASFRVIKPYFQTWLLTYDVSSSSSPG